MADKSLRYYLIISILFLIFLSSCQRNGPVACTADAKLCPDGTAVGRVPPDCKFAECPQATVGDGANTSTSEFCDYENDSRKYVSRSPEECSRVLFQCELSREPFFDECGCGCELIDDTNQAQTNETQVRGNQTEDNATSGIELQKNYCTPEQKQAEACIQLYQPVCGWFDERVQCPTYPCAATYSNSCFACMDGYVAYWTEGECPA